MKHFLFLILLIVASFTVKAQNELIVGQYIHNQFAINPSFAGNREGLTIFGGYRKQWTGIEQTPQSILLTTHAPLKNDNLVIGLSLYNQSIHQSMNSGAMFTIGYRAKTTEHTWLAFALQPGASMRTTNWTKTKLIDADDVAFSEKESTISPLLGFGMSWYGRQFFVGASVTSLFVSDDFDQRDAEFAPADANYIATAGYMFNLGDDFKIQPSVMAQINKKQDTAVDATLTTVYRDFIWVDLAYRTIGEAVMGAAVNVKPQLRIAYNYDFSIGDMKGYNFGSHEISIQYDFVYKVKTVSPKFF